MSISLGDVCYVEKYNCKVIVYETFEYGVSRIAYVSDETDWFVTGRCLWISEDEFVVCGANCAIPDDLLTPTGINRVDLTKQIEEHFENDFFIKRRKNKYERCIKRRWHWIEQRIRHEFGTYPKKYKEFVRRVWNIIGRIGYCELGAVMSRHEGLM